MSPRRPHFFKTFCFSTIECPLIASEKNSKWILQIQCVIETAVECKVTLYKNFDELIPTLDFMGKTDMTQPVIWLILFSTISRQYCFDFCYVLITQSQLGLTGPLTKRTRVARAQGACTSSIGGAESYALAPQAPPPHCFTQGRESE